MPTQTNDTTDPFPRILEGIRRRISGHQFDTWFGRVALSAPSERDLVVAVPNAFHQEWMAKEFKNAVHKSAVEVYGRPIEVRFLVDTSLRAIAAPRPSASAAAVEATSIADVSAPAPIEPGARPRPNATSTAEPSVAASPPRSSAPRPAPGSEMDELAGPFPIVLDPRYTFENFILGPSNQIAYASARAVADNPSRSTNPLFIYGSVGLGKTHLLQAVCHELLRRHPDYRIVYLSCEGFTNQFVRALQCNRLEAFRERYRKADMLVVDDIHFLAGKERTQEEFFHTFNALHQHGRQVVLSSDAPPSDIPTLEERLISRFKWGLVERLERPETETRMAILRHKADAIGLALPGRRRRVHHGERA